MPKQVKISKDDILRAALEIVRNDGIERVSNREIAKKLNCSIRPIYYQFENSEDLLNELNKKIREKEPPLTREDEMAEFMFLGLRMTRGISKAEFERQFGSEIDAIYGDVLRKYKSMGLLLEENGRIFLSREGIHVSNSVMADFLP